MILYVIVIEYSNDQYDLVNLKFHASSSTFVNHVVLKIKAKRTNGFDETFLFISHN